MWKNFIKIAYRNVLRYKGYSLLNITGLAVGLACSILIMLYVMDEWSFDKFHAHSQDLYRVMTEAHYTEDVRQFSPTPAPLCEALKEDFPEIEHAARLAYSGRSLVKYADMSFYESGIRLVDPEFLQMFSFPFVKGSPEDALTDPYSIILTREMAEKYFGNDDPIGKAMNLDGEDFQVTGVIEDVPPNSHLQFDILLPFELVILSGRRVHWGGHFYLTYIHLKSGTSHEALNLKLPEWTAEHTFEPVRYFLQPITDIHLHYENALTYIIIFTSVAVFVILIAIINFVNISTARAHSRALEVGIRKVIGARRSDVMRQFFGEYLILAFLATMVALLLVEVSLPSFNQLSGKMLTFRPFADLHVLIGLIGVVLLTGILSGLYPSFILSSFQPVTVLKGIKTKGQSKLWFRRILVIVQFTLSITLIASTIIVYKQLHFSRNKDLGFNKDLMVSIPIRGDLQEQYASFKQELLQFPGIADVTAGSGMPNGRIDSEWGQINWEGKNPEHVLQMYHYAVDYNYLNAFEMEIVDGRNFSQEIASDTMNFILNQAAVRATGLESSVGKQFTLLWRKGTIIGVVKDFHTFSTHYQIRPLIIRMLPPRFWNYVFVKLDHGSHNVHAALDHIKKTWHNFIPDYPIEYEFLDEQIEADYRSEIRMGRIINAFAILAIFIAALGLFSMASFKAEQRTKEIGIRKTLGASVSNIVLLISREFAVLSIIAGLIAAPITYFAMSKWLQNFAFRTTIDIWVFLFAAASALLLALLTVSLQAFKAAASDPVKSLRYE